LRSGYVSIIHVMYDAFVKRLQIMIDEDLDTALDQLAQKTGRSKAALIRTFVRERIKPLPPLSADPLGRMVGADDFESAPIDDVVYR
jgi:predicted DNA-binding protein